MLTITQHRDKEGMRYGQGTYQASPEEAIYKLIKYELAFGGQFTEVSAASMTVVTHIWA